MTQTGISANQAAMIAPRPYPPTRFTQTRNTFENQLLHPNRIYGFNPHGFQAPRGYGMDLNGDGKFDTKNDGFLSFDLNRDGRHSDHEIQQSRNMLKAFSGDFDSNADGRVDYNEYWQGFNNFFQAQSMDMNRDGVLSNWELQRAGGAVVKHNPKADFGRNASPWTVHSLDNLPGNRRLEQFNPWNGTYTSSFNWHFLASTNV